jgi:hypothetical protein
MLNDEDADQEKGINCAKSERKPNRIIYAEVHRNPQSNKGPETAKQLANGATSVRFLIFSNNRLPVPKTLVNLFCACLDGVLHALDSFEYEWLW